MAPRAIASAVPPLARYQNVDLRLRPRRLRDGGQFRIEARTDDLGRTSLVTRAHDRELSHIGLCIGLVLTARADRLLHLLGVLHQMGAEAVQTEAHVDRERLADRSPLRWARQLRRI